MSGSLDFFSVVTLPSKGARDDRGKGRSVAAKSRMIGKVSDLGVEAHDYLADGLVLALFGAWWTRD